MLKVLFPKFTNDEPDFPLKDGVRDVLAFAFKSKM